jgi:hypothetical protein
MEGQMFSALSARTGFDTAKEQAITRRVATRILRMSFDLPVSESKCESSLTPSRNLPGSIEPAETPCILEQSWHRNPPTAQFADLK